MPKKTNAAKKAAPKKAASKKATTKKTLTPEEIAAKKAAANAKRAATIAAKKAEKGFDWDENKKSEAHAALLEKHNRKEPAKAKTLIVEYLPTGMARCRGRVQNYYTHQM